MRMFNWKRIRLLFAAILALGFIRPVSGEIYLTYTNARHTQSKIDDCGSNTIIQFNQFGISKISINGGFEEKQLKNLTTYYGPITCLDENTLFAMGWNDLVRYNILEDSLEILPPPQRGIIHPRFVRDSLNRLYLNTDNAIFRLNKEGPFQEAIKMPDRSSLITDYAVSDSNDFLVSTFTNILYHFVGDRIDTIRFPSTGIFSDIFEDKYLVLGGDSALLVDRENPLGKRLEWVLEPFTESELYAALATDSAEGRKIERTFFEQKTFKAIIRIDSADNKIFAKTYPIKLGPTVEQFLVISAPPHRSKKKFLLTSHGLYYLGIDSFPASITKRSFRVGSRNGMLLPFNMDVLGRSKPHPRGL